MQRNIYRADADFIIQQLKSFTNHETPNTVEIEIRARLLLFSLGGPYGDPWQHGGSLFLCVKPECHPRIGNGLFQLRMGMRDLHCEVLAHEIETSPSLVSGIWELAALAAADFRRFKEVLYEMAYLQTRLNRVYRGRHRFILKQRGVELPARTITVKDRSLCLQSKQIVRLRKFVAGHAHQRNSPLRVKRHHHRNFETKLAA